MKNIQFILKVSLLAFGLCFSQTACDFTDIEPQDIISDENAIESIEDAEQAVLGFYSRLRTGAYYGGAMLFNFDVASDDARRGSQNLGSGITVHTWQYNANLQEAQSIFLEPYIVIRRANILLNRIDALEGEEAVKNQYKGEALFVRALAHFDLARIFAGNYANNPGGLGIPLVTSEIPADAEPARNTLQETYTQIIADLEQASQLMTQDLGTIRAGSMAAKALMARVYLYMEDWSNAKAMASDVITNSGLSLATGSDYEDMWNSTDANSEIIFKLSITNSDQILLGNNYWNEQIGGVNGLVAFGPTEDLLNLYESGDIRSDAFYLERLPAAENVLVKYRGANNGLADIKVLRLSEMYLIRAEANIEGSLDAAQALSDLNALRAARGLADAPNDNLTLRVSVERRRELAFEGHRWFDIKRRGESILRNDCNTTNCSLAAGDCRFVWPIPESELFTNPNMEQNGNGACY